MTGLRTRDRAVGLEPGDHASWAYDDVTELKSVCVDYFADGLVRSERLMYVGGRPHDALLDDLARLPGRDAMLADGRLTVLTVMDSLDVAGAFDPQAELRYRKRIAEEAVDAGYAGLRVAGDITEFVVRPELMDSLVEFEMAVDAAMSTAPVTSLCAFHRQRTGRSWRQVSALHMIQHAPDKHPTFSVGRSGPALTLVGEIDVASVDDVDAVLDRLQLTATGPITFELPDLSFIDVAGTRRLAAFRRSMEATGRAVTFRRLSPAARRTFRAFALIEEQELA